MPSRRWHEVIRLDANLKGVRLRGSAVDQAALREAEEKAFERGREAGERTLREQLLQQRHELIELQNGLLQSLRNAIPTLVQNTEKELVLLALEAARQLVSACPITPEQVEGAIRETLAKAESTTGAVVFLHPEDYAMLERANTPRLLGNAGGDAVKFQASLEVTRGGCLLETNFGVVDARRESKYDALKTSLIG